MSDGKLPNVEQISNASDYNKLVDRATAILSGLKQLDYASLKEELRQLNFTMSENPSLQQLNMEIQKIQASKDRITEIMMDATNDYIMKQRVCDVLVEGWQKFSSEGSADKRKADSAVTFSQYIFMAAEAESFYKVVINVMKNLDYKHESASRRVTCFHLSLKLRDIARGTPDSDYSMMGMGGDTESNKDHGEWADRSDKEEKVDF